MTECAHCGVHRSGVIERDGSNESMRALAIMAAFGPADEFVVAGCEKPHGSAFEAAAEIAKQIHRGNPSVRQMLLHPSALDLQPMEATVAGIDEVIPDVSVFGAVAVGLADPTLDLVSGATCSFVPAEDPFEITSFNADIVHALDRKPAWRSITSRLGLPETAAMAEVGAIAVFAAAAFTESPPEWGSRFILGGGPIRTPSGDLMLTLDCDQSTLLHLLMRDEPRIFDGVERLVRNLQDRCGEEDAAAIFHADCAARGKAMFDRIAKEELVGIMLSSLMKHRSIPWLGYALLRNEVRGTR